jgi:N-acetylglucosamine-6-phosphate deacetylase
LLVRGGDLYTPFEVIEDGAVLARDGVIEYAGARSAAPPVAAETEIDASGLIVCPGFIDLQVNGGGGSLLTEEPGVDAVARMTAAHVGHGTTALLPTIVTAPEETMIRAVEAVRRAVERAPGGSRILGAHIEGPFINPRRRGAHDPRSIRAPDPGLLHRLLTASGSALRVITLAPELPGALDLIAQAREGKVAVSIGHTDASYEEALAAIDAGATLATHVFNAMRALTHRDPGVLGAILERDEVTATVIPDGVHVHPVVLSLLARAKGPGRLTLVTDALAFAGTDATTLELYGGRVELRDGACYLSNGTLAGSAITMDVAVRNMHRRAGVPLLEAVRMATATPARAIGRAGEVGSLQPGALADVVLCDRNLTVQKVFVGGALVYEA